MNGYLQDKKVKTKNEMMEGELILGPDDDEDEEMQSVASSGEEVPKPRRGGDEDDDSEEGASFRTSLRVHTHFLTLIFTSLQTRTSKRLTRTRARPPIRTRPTRAARPHRTRAATATS